ncbi:MAG: DNA polymerase III subunit gamma and tau, partial [Nocardioides sp.]
MESPLALYRRHRPETFADVIGQEHVTSPLRAALANNRVNHAYLFSGPRGCGKTTSARILARALNCEQAPVADPCGECDSCRDLARDGAGSIDVIEIDAASHGGVDDARDLREKAFFSPVKSRYKVYIIDEAHMVTTQGFNALLKLVEEPPPHLRFIFATTEPDKVLPTIRSRTHHYPFRLIPPRLLSAYLSELCEKEGVAIEPAALPLIVRAGGGSARDSLSVLDQLLGGAGPEGVTHVLATGLLGYTPDSLLDDVVDAFAAGDGAAVFEVVDRVIETGQDPRRFAEDLLRRLRDLVIVAAVPDAPATGLIDVSVDQGERLVAQSARFGPSELSRAADLVAAGLTEMRGATAPRLLLELICARVLLPGSDHGTDGLMARIDRLEKRAAISGGAPSHAVASQAPSPPVEHPVEPVAEASAPPILRPDPTPAAPEAPVQEAPTPGPTPREEAAPVGPSAPAQPAEAPPEGGLTLVEVRRLWPDIVEATKLRRRVAWMHLTQNSQVIGVEGNTLVLGFNNAGARDSFLNGGCDEILRQAAIDVVGMDWKVDAIVDPGARPDAP